MRLPAGDFPHASGRGVPSLLRGSLVLLLALALPGLPGCGASDPAAPEGDGGGLQVVKRPDPVLTSDRGLVADPSVIRQGDTLLMVYSDYRLSSDSIVFNAARSTDGIRWEPVFDDPDARVFSGNPGAWDGRIETPEIVEIDGTVHLYYIGYPESDFTVGVYASQIGVAVDDGTGVFRRLGPDPALPRGGRLDQDALTSPAVIPHAGGWTMLYTGWRRILEAGGFLGLTGAVSTDGREWTKTDREVLPSILDTPFETATEADLEPGGDGWLYLFFSAENGIAMARSRTPAGPWAIWPEPIVVADRPWESGEVVAPTALVEDGRVRLWYTGVVGDFTGASIGYVEFELPREWP